MANIPVNMNDVLKITKTVHDAVYGFLQSLGIPCWIAMLAASVVAFQILVSAFIVAAFVQGLIGIGAFFAVNILKTIGEVRTNNADDFNQVVAASMSEALGVDIPASSLSGGKGPGGVGARLKDIGGALHGMLDGQFLTGGEITPDQGKANAEKFSGFAINFASANSFIGILAEACSIGQLKDFSELGEQMGESLGLGRLQRLALQPMIRNTIQQPLDLWYRRQLRPDRLNEAQLVQALRAGNISADDAKAQLAEKGYRDQDIAILLDQLTAKISAAEMEKLIRYNVIELQAAIDRLVNLGMSKEDAQLMMSAADEARGDSQVSSVLSNLEAARLGGFIEQVEFDAMLGDLPLSQEEERLFRKRVGFQLERPRKTITFAELKSGLINAIITFDYADTWLQNQGYSFEDQTILSYELIQAINDAAAKKKAKAKVAAKLVAANQAVPAVFEV